MIDLLTNCLICFFYLFCLSRKDRVELQLFFACFVTKLSSQANQDDSLHIVGYNLIITYKQAKRFTKNIFDKIPIMKENMWMNVVPEIGLIA